MRHTLRNEGCTVSTRIITGSTSDTQAIHKQAAYTGSNGAKPGSTNLLSSQGWARMCKMQACSLLSLLALLLAAATAAACPPGSGGPGCKFTLRSLYWEHAPSVWEGDRLAPLDLQGWNCDPELYARLLHRTNARFVVEVGVWKGASSIEFAKWLRSHGRGVVVSVDPFTGSLEHWLRNDRGWIDPTMNMPLLHGRPALYHQFRSNVRHLQLEQYVVPFPVTSRLAAAYFSAKALQVDLIHLDAGHAYADVAEDLQLWYPLLRPGGCLLADDYSAGWKGVVQAVDAWVARHGLKLRTAGNKAWFCKPWGSVAAAGGTSAGAAAGE